MLVDALRWWIVLEAAGLVALPIVFIVFRALPGRGYAFAKPVGLLLIGYGFWSAMSLELLPNRPGSIFWIVLLVVAVDVYLVRRFAADLRAAIAERWGFILAVEAVFALSFVAAIYLRSFVPEIEATEKPMDFMLLNAASRAQSYPPPDPWLAGFDVSYYYFGYVLQAMTAKMAAVATPVAFNLGLAGTAALAASAAFGLGYELMRLARQATFRAGLAAGSAALVLVLVIGNLEGALEFGMANSLLSRDLAASADVAGLDGALRSDACLLVSTPCLAYPSEESSFWWWWRATRISPDGNSITEFPFFSFLLGDLHPHGMALPFVLSLVGLALALWRAPARLTLQTWARRPVLLIFGAILLGGLGFLNTWDLPTIGFLVAALVLARNIAFLRQPRAEGTDWRPGQREGQAIKDSAGFVLPLLLLAVVLYTPFYLSFSSQASGLAPVVGEATRPLHSFLFWAPLLAVTLPLTVALIFGERRAYEPRRMAWAAAVPLALLLLWVLAVAISGRSLVDALVDRGANWLTAVFFAAALGACLLSLWRALEQPDEDGNKGLLIPVLVMMATALLLMLGAELFYIEDLFGSRLNSVFKLYYQAWLLLGVSGAASAFWLVQRWQPRTDTGRLLRGAWTGMAGIVVLSAMLYPLGATLSRTEGLARPGRTLDGLAFARQSAQGEYAIADWLRRRAGPDERLVEASGDQYTDASRISAWSGVPGVLGWPGHEVQWGRDGTMLGVRRKDVDDAYSTDSLAGALAILRKYDVTYVVVGSRERGKYPARGLDKFAGGLPEVVRAGQAVLYRIPRGLDGTEPEVKLSP